MGKLWQNKIARRIIKFIAAIALFCLIFYILFFWQGSTKEIETEANKLAIPSAWQLVYEHKSPPMVTCLDKLGCPGLAKSWKLDRIYTPQEIEQVFAGAGMDAAVEGDCEDTSTANEPRMGICSAEASNGEYKYRMFQMIDSSYPEYPNPVIDLYIKTVK